MSDVLPSGPVAAVNRWLEDHWDPDLSVGEWWSRLGLSGWAAPSLPCRALGKGLARHDAVAVQEAIADFGALPAPGGLGLLLAAPTIAKHGDPGQVERFVRPVVTGEEAWCQLFSEPAAGSDLAGLRSRAERDGDEWVVNGQKVWTSGAEVADRGMLLVRTDPAAPKHRGLTYFALDMCQPGVEVRPLREMTGRSLFNEVFLTDVRVHERDMIGDLGGGWAVANSTLMFERSGLSAGGGSEGAIGATPGTRAGDLDRRAGDFVAGGSVTNVGGQVVGWYADAPSLLARMAGQGERVRDPHLRQKLVELYILVELGRLNAVRLKAAVEAGGDILGMPNIGKLTMSEMVRRTRDVGLEVLGSAGMLHSYANGDTESEPETPSIGDSEKVLEMALFASAPCIYGGTDQIQRNILAERVLGLPREPAPDRSTPFDQIPPNG